MRERKSSGRGGRRRSAGDGEPDLFAKQLSEVVQQAFAAAADKPGEVTVALPIAPSDDDGLAKGLIDSPHFKTPPQKIEVVEPQEFSPGPELAPDEAPQIASSTESIPARMLNEFVYLPPAFLLRTRRRRLRGECGYGQGRGGASAGG